MKRVRVATRYTSDFLEAERPQPLSDKRIDQLIGEVLSGNMDRDISDEIYTRFKSECTQWLLSSRLNTLTGLDDYHRVDIMNGCTQFIDSLYMQGPVQTIQGDYRYHQRLGHTPIKTEHELKSGVPLIIAMPFPSTGDIYRRMKELLDVCLDKQIPVHIDGAWYTCCRDIVFDAGHPAIRSIGISLSKGLGLGWNRIGLRWTRETAPDAITIQNDFSMNLRAPVIIARHFLKNLEPDYLWSTHGERYYKVCRDFSLEPTKSIYLANYDRQPVGVSPLIRYLEENDIAE